MTRSLARISDASLALVMFMLRNYVELGRCVASSCAAGVPLGVRLLHHQGENADCVGDGVSFCQPYGFKGYFIA